MARIELRDCTVRIKDGLGAHPDIYPCVADGNKTLTPGKTAVQEGDTGCKVSNVSIPVAVGGNTQKVPVGARFTLDGETAETVHVVTARTQGPVSGTNAKQSVSLDATPGGAPTGGSFTLAWGGKTTGNINHNSDTSTVKTALVAMDDGYGTDDWAVTGEAGAWVVEFKGALGSAPRALLVGDGTNLTGGGGLVKTVTVATTVAGVAAVGSSATADITFSPALGAGSYGTDAAITFLPQLLEVKIGEGNITYTEHNEYNYLLDRDNLDTVKEGKEVPMDVKWDSVYEHITTGTSENISPMDALKGIGAAAEWINYAADPCEPYAVAIEVEHVPPCGTSQGETTLFPDFRSEQREVNFKDATISVTGKCNVTEPIVSRAA
jgi:hypothetical protein